ncbi:MAG: hypothetical protein HY718_16640, partial [Planctomycetes bacterium]|nr:hypothetical protein [Planctomycetota bacterium]
MRKLEPKKVLLYGLMLTGAIVGLAIDRLRGPEAAEAASSGPLTDSGAGNAAAGRTEEVHGPAIARVFEAATPEKQATQPTAGPPRDAFGLTDELRRHFEELSPTRKAEQVRQAESEEERRRQQAEQFLGSHRLKGTTLRDGEAWA